MQIKTQTEYAIQILLFMSKKNDFTTRAELSAALKIAENYLPKIITKLAHAGFIKSYPGASGGSLLNCDASRITVWNVMVAMNDAAFANTVFENAEPELPIKRSCKKLLSSYGEMSELFFNSVTISDLSCDNELDRYLECVTAKIGEFPQIKKA